MKISGNTNSNFEICKWRNITAIKKSADGAAGNRLLIQAEKQQHGMRHDNVEPVSVFDVIKNDKFATIVMPYISSGTFIDFAELNYQYK